MESESSQIISDDWENLKQFTDARIALGRTGASLPTGKLLDFQLAHARARDAVYTKLDISRIESELSGLGFEPMVLETLAQNRNSYLKNPDLGKKISKESEEKLRSAKKNTDQITILIGDGLSARAIQENAFPFIKEFVSIMKDDRIGRKLPIVQEARVAVGDQIGELLESEMIVTLIGERPGLSSPNSLGIYLTYNPREGRRDSDRNCISNIRPEGLSFWEAAEKLRYLIREARKLRLTGVNLKDDMVVGLDSNPEKSLDTNKFT